MDVVLWAANGLVVVLMVWAWRALQRWLHHVTPDHRRQVRRRAVLLLVALLVELGALAGIGHWRESPAYHSAQLAEARWRFLADALARQPAYSRVVVLVDDATAQNDQYLAGLRTMLKARLGAACPTLTTKVLTARQPVVSCAVDPVENAVTWPGDGQLLASLLAECSSASVVLDFTGLIMLEGPLLADHGWPADAPPLMLATAWPRGEIRAALDDGWLSAALLEEWPVPPRAIVDRSGRRRLPTWSIAEQADQVALIAGQQESSVVPAWLSQPELVPDLPIN